MKCFEADEFKPGLSINQWGKITHEVRPFDALQELVRRIVPASRLDEVISAMFQNKMFIDRSLIVPWGEAALRLDLTLRRDLLLPKAPLWLAQAGLYLYPGGIEDAAKAPAIAIPNFWPVRPKKEWSAAWQITEKRNSRSSYQMVIGEEIDLEKITQEVSSAQAA